MCAARRPSRRRTRRTPPRPARSAPAATSPWRGGEQSRTRSARQIANAQGQAANRAAATNAIRDTMHQTRSGRPINQRLLNNEVQRGLSQRLAEHAERNLARRTRAVARSGSVIFIAAGLYSMREDIALAMQGPTAGTDRSR